jgi:hypothetical protein
MKKPNPNSMIFGVAWFNPEQYQALLKVAADKDKLETTHSEWLVHANKALRQLRSQGMKVEPVEIDIDELVAWCQERGIPLDSSARSQYAAEKIQEKYAKN